MARKSFDVAVVELCQSIGAVVRRARLAAPEELSWSEASVMKTLAFDGPVTTAALARAQGMRPQSMGTIIATLEEAGMLERKPHPTDGRQFLIALTAKGAAAQKNHVEAKRSWLAQAIAQLDKQEQETLFAAGEILKRLAEQ